MKNKTHTCTGCPFLGKTNLDSDPNIQWYVCKHAKVDISFLPSGRYIELNDFPDWCPKLDPIKQQELNVITHRSLEDSFVRVIHEPTGICEESNLYKSTHKNREDAMRKIATRLEIIVGDKDGSEREVEVLTEDGFSDKPSGDE